jgi:hypothetical protein
MSKPLAPVPDLEALRAFARGVRRGASKHGHDVQWILQALLGAIVEHAEPGSYRARATEMRCVIGGRGYAFRFARELEPKRVEIRETHNTGPLVAYFDNATAPQDVAAIFDRLARGEELRA